MKKVLVLVTITAAFLMVGCGSGEAGDVAGGKPIQNPEPAKNKANGKSGVADATAAPAPAGVKTGTPGG